ncbi:MAG: APC family permease [Pelomonas sp.]|nr:APC family permease [Roseateles sp.]
MRDDGKIGVVVATAMSITIVVGAGLLALPGLSYGLAGRLGYVPWVLVAVLMLPLLAIFAFFASAYPSAGGVVGYIRAALGYRVAAMAEAIVLGTFSLGIPAIALIGSGYLTQVVPGPTPTESALGVVAIAYLAGVVGLKISGAIQTGIAALIVLGLTTIGVGFLLTSAHAPVALAPMPVDPAGWRGVLAALPVILFAYTGWEMTAFLAEDMRDPRRDMPVSIWTSFGVVAIMYVFIAWIVASFAGDDAGWRSAPFVQLARPWLGELGAQAVGVIAALLVLANVIGAFFSASRAVYAAGRDGLLPDVAGAVDRRGQPLFAMTACWAIFSGVIVATRLGGLGVEGLLQLAGQNFFVLYFLCAIGYLGLRRRAPFGLVLGLLAVAVVGAMLCLFSVPGLVYCASLAGMGLLLSLRRRA